MTLAIVVLGWLSSSRLGLQVDKFAFVLGDYKKECWYWCVIQTGHMMPLRSAAD